MDDDFRRKGLSRSKAVSNDVERLDRIVTVADLVQRIVRQVSVVRDDKRDDNSGHDQQCHQGAGQGKLTGPIPQLAVSVLDRFLRRPEQPFPEHRHEERDDRHQSQQQNGDTDRHSRCRLVQVKRRQTDGRKPGQHSQPAVENRFSRRAVRLSNGRKQLFMVRELLFKAAQQQDAVVCSNSEQHGN